MDEQTQMDGLEKEELEAWEASEIAQLFPLLRGGLFHRTGIQGFRGIFDTGFIFPNTGQFPTSYPQTKHYYGFSKRYISVFDFHEVHDAQCISNYHVWGSFFFDHKPLTISFRLNRNMLIDKLIPNVAGPKLGSPEYKAYIAYVEAWYPEPISVKAVQSFLLVAQNPQTHKLVFEEFQQSDFHEVETLIARFESFTTDRDYRRK